MAFKLKKTEITVLNLLAQGLKEKREKLAAALVTYNEEASKLWAQVDALAVEYNEELAEARDFVEGHHEDWRGQYDDKSERWQEGDAAQAANELIEEWENAELDESGLEEPPEVTLEEDAFNHGEILENLRTEAE